MGTPRRLQDARTARRSAESRKAPPGRRRRRRRRTTSSYERRREGSRTPRVPQRPRSDPRRLFLFSLVLVVRVLLEVRSALLGRSPLRGGRVQRPSVLRVPAGRGRQHGRMGRGIRLPLLRGRGGIVLSSVGGRVRSRTRGGRRGGEDIGNSAGGRGKAGSGRRRRRYGHGIGRGRNGHLRVPRGAVVERECQARGRRRRLGMPPSPFAGRGGADRGAGECRRERFLRGPRGIGGERRHGPPASARRGEGRRDGTFGGEESRPGERAVFDRRRTHATPAFGRGDRRRRPRGGDERSRPIPVRRVRRRRSAVEEYAPREGSGVGLFVLDHAGVGGGEYESVRVGGRIGGRGGGAQPHRSEGIEEGIGEHRGGTVRRRSDGRTEGGDDRGARGARRGRRGGEELVPTMPRAFDLPHSAFCASSNSIVHSDHVFGTCTSRTYSSR
mmetsp:Transcript_41195/g.124516  ORF Transcript_41195/g.124516 Transcript_41195/m.124516 type:complete len:442 (-) Transcript_41195:200-1525(-)